MKVIVNPPHQQWARLCERPSAPDEGVRARVAQILRRVREEGDEGLRSLTREIDGTALGPIEVSREEMLEAERLVSDELKRAIEVAAGNIRRFHEAQLPRQVEVETTPGVRCIQRPVPLGKVGLYVPGGTAPLFSTVLMLAIPAAVAGCGEAVLCTPAGKDGKVPPAVLYAAAACKVSRVFKVGGAQAIAAMAYGTESVPKVDKIFGPGNRWVTTAKQMVGADTVAIDMPAGPSEVMVIADEAANPAYVAADLLSQAEHGPDSQVILLCRSAGFAERVGDEAACQAAKLGRGEFISGSLSHSHAIVFSSEADAVDFANAYAPEHLIVNTVEPWGIVGGIRCAGSVFVGAFSPESAGDYASGTNHCLPTNGWARSLGGVNVEAFMRRMTIQELSRDGLAALGGTITALAAAEGLEAHANAVRVRGCGLPSVDTQDADIQDDGR